MKQLIVYIIILFCLLSVKSFGCSCLTVDTEGAFKQSNYVVKAKVVKIESYKVYDWQLRDEMVELGLKIDSSFYSHAINKVIIKVKFAFKGAEKGSILTIYTSHDTGLCGYPFKKGRKYLIYGYESTNTDPVVDNKSAKWTGLCTRTKRFEKKEAIELKRIKADNKR